ncbi:MULTISPECIES: hypothetical protein [unclassified Arenibacter]|uniref:TapB family protein n=1 Tax=unclassified Arenibacter TaxID=2615047 RepID=UPI000E357DC1|nr:MULTISPECIES: hypothetical protein [unclassified Arenibacter]MCM4163549.1 hypothetical protein [Arenibacter sp. A80]RFT56774.1 hypothetical protein D0S24_08045 [Arenibacter sp. P308M17]
MRTLALIYSFFLFTSNALSQDCSKFYPMEEGSSFQYTMTNKKGKTEGITDYTITKVENSGGVTNATMNMRFTDEKGKEIMISDYKMSCAGGAVKIDYNSLVPSQMMKQYTDMGMEMDISGTDIELPNDLSVGQDLADANVAMTIKMTGMNMTVKVDQLNRKVEKKESITTPAGTFDCYVLSQENVSETMGVKQIMPSKLWLAEGVGMVRQETYNKKGELSNQMQLTKFNN